MAHSDKSAREWLLFIIGAVASAGAALTGFVLIEIMHIEARLAVVEYRVGLPGPKLSFLRKQEKSHDGHAESLASIVPFVCPAQAPNKKTVAK